MIYPYTAHVPLVKIDEDAPPVANDRFIIVCDGLGGNGKAKHTDENNQIHTGAYFGSRLISKHCESFFSEHYDELLDEAKVKQGVDSLSAYLSARLNEALQQYPKVDNLTGDSIFPSTLAAAVYREEETYVDATVIWAGDSRVYMFTAENWLQQLSRDDVEGEFDACSGKDCKMTNCISQNEPFSINYARYKLPKQAVIFACSDGCFDFIDSPMHFEKMIAQALCLYEDMNSETLSISFGDMLVKMRSGDDCSLAGVSINCDGIQLLQAVKDRRAEELNRIIEEFDSAGSQYESIVEQNRRQLQSLMAQVRQLKPMADDEKRALFLNLFKAVKKGDGLTGDLQHVSNLLVATDSTCKYEPYSDYMGALAEREKLIDNNIKTISSYDTTLGVLRVQLRNAECSKQMAQWRSRHMPASRLSADEMIKAERNNCYMYCKELTSIISSYGITYKLNEGISIYECRETLFSCIDKFRISVDRISNLEIDERDKEQEIYASLTDNVLDKILSELEKEGGVKRYKGFIQQEAFGELSEKFNRYRELKPEYDAIAPDERQHITLEEKVADFEKNFLPQHLQPMFECIASDPRVRSMTPNTEKYRQVSESQAQLIRNIADADSIKHKVWLGYKNNYEKYRTTAIIKAGV